MKPFNVFPYDSNIDFMRLRWVSLAVAFLLMVVALGAIGFKGFNFALDFTGGVGVELRYAKPPDVDAVRARLEANGFPGAQVQAFGSGNDLLVRLQTEGKQAGGADKASGGSVSLSYGDVDLPVIHPADIEAKLGASERWNGIRALILGYEDAYIVNFPFRTYVKTQPALIEARWTRIRKTEGTQPVGKDAAPEGVPGSAENSALEEQAIEATTATTTYVTLPSGPRAHDNPLRGKKIAVAKPKEGTVATPQK